MDHSNEIAAAMYAHTKWISRLKNAISQGTSEFDPQIVMTDNNCEFGKWLYGDFPGELKTLPLYQEIKQVHANFHIQAGNILELAMKGDKDLALKKMNDSGEFMGLSRSLVSKLNQLKKLSA